MISNEELREKIGDWGFLSTLEAIKIDQIEDSIVRESVQEFQVALEKVERVLEEAGIIN